MPGRRPPPAPKTRAEEAPEDTVRRVLLQHKDCAYHSPSHPVRCQCGAVLAGPGEILNWRELHTDHQIHALAKEGLTWRN